MGGTEASHNIELCLGVERLVAKDEDLVAWKAWRDGAERLLVEVVGKVDA